MGGGQARLSAAGEIVAALSWRFRAATGLARLWQSHTYELYKSYFGKRTVRVTLLGRQCDAMIGLPLSDDFMGPAVIFSRGIAVEAYALVSARNQPIAGIDDRRENVSLYNI
jgi:hypothetical protein